MLKIVSGAKRVGRVVALGRAGCLGLGAVVLLAPAPVSAAGLLEFLFGGFSDRRPAFEYSPPPLEMRVSPRHARPAGPAADRKVVRQIPIDPVKNPQWYLDDPTMRRGDIVVLKGRVLVYEGTHHAPEDFTILNKSRLVSAREKERISRMARKGPFDDSPVVPIGTTSANAPTGDTTPREATLRPTN